MRKPQKMTKTRFDKIIRDNVEKEARERGEEVQLGYIINGKPYDDYYTEEAFELFKKEMENEYEKIHEQFRKGDGTELKKRKNYPPKMASVASSSRFCYLALRDGSEKLGLFNVEVEKKCEIEGLEICDSGNQQQKVCANLDAFCEEKSTYIEAKCHEIFDSHKVIMSKRYRGLLSKEFDIKVSGGEKIDIPLEKFGIRKKSTRFDIKQLLCHLLGVKDDRNKRYGMGEEATLTYLFFKPVVDENEKNMLDTVFKELYDEISAIFISNPISTFTKKNNIKLNVVEANSKVMKGLDEMDVKYIDWLDKKSLG